VWHAFRQVIPLTDDPAVPRDRPIHEIAANFIRDRPAAGFVAHDDREPNAK
jgi:hypothetical protein